ncbi:MAG TPA: MBL fold metallo-hydrolase [Thermoplasmata archaeon]|nr:MBL fold metallo-hydrolase [Thermoplasmata archaeon]
MAHPTCVISDLGNGVAMRTDGCIYRFDPDRAVHGDINLVSHAHSDHVPNYLGRAPITCSRITHDLIRLRRKKVERRDEPSADSMEAGHAPGSVMFLVDGASKVLYTGDFCTRVKGHLSPARPIGCDVLVMECTYGKPEYEFPDHRETMRAVRDWVEETLGSGSNAVLLAYPLGKAQELCFELRDHPIRVEARTAENHHALNDHGFRLPVDTDTGPRVGQPFVYVTPGAGAERAKVDCMAKHGAKAAAFTGWAVRRFGGRAKAPSTEMFPLSDHCDYNELMEFVRLCGPGKVFTTHGFTEEFARSVRRELGIDAEPLRKGQGTLDAFL